VVGLTELRIDVYDNYLWCVVTREATIQRLLLAYRPKDGYTQYIKAIYIYIHEVCIVQRVEIMEYCTLERWQLFF
jgi:hypothetical protein